MSSFPSSLKSVFSGMAAANVSFPVHLARSWPLMRLAAPMMAPLPVEGLAKMVESEIIPRLIQAHPLAQLANNALTNMDIAEDGSTGPEATEAFARMLLTRPIETLTSFIETLVKAGVAMQTIYDDLLTPTASLLGDLWDQDRVSYTEVTIGLGRLQQLVHGLDWQTPYNGENDAGSRSAIFSPRPGEQQTFGFYVMEEMFRWSGWRAWVETCATNAQIASNVQLRWFDMFCLSVSRDTKMEEVSDTIKEIRRASRNQDLFVLVYGRPFVEHPELVAESGADAAVSSAAEALSIADQTVSGAATD